MKFVKPLLVCLALIAGFYAPDLVKQLRGAQEGFDLSGYCMLSTLPCTQNQVTMTLEHDFTQPLVPSKLTIVWPEQTSEDLAIKLEGLEMNMGIARYKADRLPDGHYQTTLLLPVCTFEKMTWVGTISDNKNSVSVAIRMER
ncbi:hypothetical protein L3Q72_18700 [Vibrio sp. JC009]|uniref:hypothetical protein n=1 Tax=Vibrio sp. JC009 TaxID=2912314 RepID=UPI0023AF183F|nr:hypothetical protein [Vibrio sp. JC009]WED24905.1 hypothetical protein L3Q72_18700 [Vibrio sp. JC009]